MQVCLYAVYTNNFTLRCSCVCWLFDLMTLIWISLMSCNLKLFKHLHEKCFTQEKLQEKLFHKHAWHWDLGKVTYLVVGRRSIRWCQVYLWSICVLVLVMKCWCTFIVSFIETSCVIDSVKKHVIDSAFAENFIPKFKLKERGIGAYYESSCLLGGFWIEAERDFKV